MVKAGGGDAFLVRAAFARVGGAVAGAVVVAGAGIVVAGAAALGEAAGDAEEDGGNQETGEGGPGEGVGAHAEGGVVAGVFEDIEGVDGPGAFPLS